MSVQVKTFDEKKLKEAIKESPNIVKQYIKSLLNVSKVKDYTFSECMKKIKELSKKK